MSAPKLTKGQRKALAVLAAMPEHLGWHLHSFQKTGIAEGTLSALHDRGLVTLERYTVKETVRRTGGLSQSFTVRWKPCWRARLTDAGRAVVAEVPA
jgi:hypothetical protein